MAANKPKWPECGCTKRCDKRKCHAVGSRKLQASGAKPGSAIKSAFLGLITRKYAPEKLKLVLKLAADVPNERVICRRAGMSKSTLRYALMGSREGQPGDIFDIKLEYGGTERFHILFEDTIEAATDKIEEMAFEMATGTFRKIFGVPGQGHLQEGPEIGGPGPSRRGDLSTR
jgi:hypothetical protein